MNVNTVSLFLVSLSSYILSMIGSGTFFSQHPPDFQSFDKLLNFKFITPSAQYTTL